MLNLRIRDLLFHYKKGVILIQFYMVRVFLKNASIPQGPCERCIQDRKPAKCPLFDYINEMTSDKR